MTKVIWWETSEHPDECTRLHKLDSAPPTWTPAPPLISSHRTRTLLTCVNATCASLSCPHCCYFLSYCHFLINHFLPFSTTAPQPPPPTKYQYTLLRFFLTRLATAKAVSAASPSSLDEFAVPMKFSQELALGRGILFILIPCHPLPFISLLTLCQYCYLLIKTWGMCV
jgi:hypothetical protein